MELKRVEIEEKCNRKQGLSCNKEYTYCLFEYILALYLRYQIYCFPLLPFCL